MLYVYMTKLISLTDDVYEDLSRKKLPNESFSKTIKRLTSKKKNIFMDLAGKWPGGNEEAKRIFDEVLKERHTYTKTREFNL